MPDKSDYLAFVSRGDSLRRNSTAPAWRHGRCTCCEHSIRLGVSLAGAAKGELRWTGEERGLLWLFSQPYCC